VDGKRFFGDDPTIALRNLPAEVIDKIQVYDKLSDQAELTGFDDGQSTKTMNIITRQDRSRGNSAERLLRMGRNSAIKSEVRSIFLMQASVLLYRTEQ